VGESLQLFSITIAGVPEHGRPQPHIEGMQKARITVVRRPPSYEVWVEQGGRRHLFAIAGSFEDAQAEAAEAKKEYGSDRRPANAR